MTQDTYILEDNYILAKQKKRSSNKVKVLQQSSVLLNIQELQKIVENSRQIGIKQNGLKRIANILVDHARHHRTSCDFYKGYLTKIKVDILELSVELEKMGYTVVSHRNGFGIVEYITVSWNTNTSI